MAKMKVHELAKELNIQSKDVIAFLQEKGIEVKAAQSSVEDDAIALVKDKFGKAEASKKEETAKEEAPKKEEVVDEDSKEEGKGEDAPKKKKKIIFVSNPNNSKMPMGSRPPMSANNGNNNNKKPAQPSAAPQPAPAKQIQLGPNQMINKATGKVMEKLPPKQETPVVPEPVVEEEVVQKPEPRYLNNRSIVTTSQKKANDRNVENKNADKRRKR